MELERVPWNVANSEVVLHRFEASFREVKGRRARTFEIECGEGVFCWNFSQDDVIRESSDGMHVSGVHGLWRTKPIR